MRRRQTEDVPVLPDHLRWVNRPAGDGPDVDAWVAEWREWHEAHDVDALDALRAINLGQAS